MSISATLFNAYSGLVAASRTAAVISDNVANARTEGFGRREVVLSASSINGRGAGVRVAAIRRNVDAITISDRRLAEADLANNSTKSDMLSRIETEFGVPGTGAALSDKVTALEVALTSAQSRPDSPVRLQKVLYTASDLAGKLNTLSKTVQSERMRADKSIADQVSGLNQTLSQIDTMNKSIRLQTGAGRAVNGLKDQRQVLIDRLAKYLPIRTYARPKGQIAIISTNGAILVDGSLSKFGFTGAGVITPDMTVGTGALSGLTLNGKPISTGPGGPIGGGAISAMFEIRDRSAVTIGTRLDAVARNLIERFESPGLDPTLPPGGAGLFTDAGTRLDITKETGLAQRLSVNPSADPAQGGASWRLRDGLGATQPGDGGNSDLLAAFATALQAVKPTLSGGFSGSDTSFSGLVGDAVSMTGAARLASNEKQSFAQGRVQELRATEADSAVNTDQEMQKLMLVENAYAANARVVATVDKMLKRLMEL